MRRRLLASYLILVAAVLIGLELPLGVLFARHERSALSSDATRSASAVAGVAEERLDNEEGLSTKTFDRLIRTYGNEAHAKLTLYDADQNVVVALTGSRPDDALHPAPHGVSKALAGHADTGTMYDDSRDWTYATVPVLSGSKILGAVLLALPNEDTNERIDTAWLLLGGLAVAVLIVTTVVGWRLARWLNEPISELTETAGEVGAGRLDVRARADSGPPEIRALATRFNDMVGRLDDLVSAQRRFVADASHQLRTPLTALRLRIENLETSGDDDGSIEAALLEADRLARLLDGLLALSRAEGVRAQPSSIDVTSVVRERCEAWGALGDEQGVALRPVTSANGHAMASAIPGQLEQILDNIIANALEVSSSGSSIDIVVEPEGQQVGVVVVDHGPGMTRAQRDRAFDRFWQGADGSHGRAGLGLAIVHQLVVANHGEIELSDTPGGGLTTSIWLPSAVNGRVPVGARPV